MRKRFSENEDWFVGEIKARGMVRLIREVPSPSSLTYAWKEVGQRVGKIIQGYQVVSSVEKRIGDKGGPSSGSWEVDRE